MGDHIFYNLDNKNGIVKNISSPSKRRIVASVFTKRGDFECAGRGLTGIEFHENGVPTYCGLSSMREIELIGGEKVQVTNITLNSLMNFTVI